MKRGMNDSKNQEPSSKPPEELKLRQDTEDIEDIEKAGRYILETFCKGEPLNQPRLLPPIPNSNYIDKFSEQKEDLTDGNLDDKRHQEDYAAEVAVYRTFENFEEDILVLHHLEKTNRQYKLFVKDHAYKDGHHNGPAGESDFVVIGENYAVIIEVSNVKFRDKVKNRIKKVFKEKRVQGERMKTLIENILKTGNKESHQQYPHIQWYCAFLSISASDKNKFQFLEKNKSRIIFKDSFPEDQKVFQSWWAENILKKIPGSPTHEDHNLLMMRLRNILTALWCIDSENKFNYGENCSLGSNIMKVDGRLREADITYGFREVKGGQDYTNKRFVKAHGAFLKVKGIKHLTKEQDELFKSEKNFQWINAPAGSGKTVLILAKAIQIAESGKAKVVIFRNKREDSSKDIYTEILSEAGIKFTPTDTTITEQLLERMIIDDITSHLADKLYNCLQEDPSVVLVEYSNPNTFCALGGLQLIYKIIKSVDEKRGANEQDSWLIDDENCLLRDLIRDHIHRNEAALREFERHATSKKRKIWICVDLAQSETRTPLPVDKRINMEKLEIEESLKDAYMNRRLNLNLNLRNTCDISNVITLIRTKSPFARKDSSGHFLHGPKPQLNFFKCSCSKDNAKIVESCKNVVEGELEKVTDSDKISSSHIVFIYNTYNAKSILQEGKLGERIRTNHFGIHYLASTTSEEWPVAIFLMDVADVNFTGNDTENLFHQLYRGLSRGRVYCSAILYQSDNYPTIEEFLEKLPLEKLECYAKVSFLDDSGQKLVKEASRAPKTSTPESRPDAEITDADDSEYERGIGSYTELHRAVEQDNLDKVRDLVNDGADVNAEFKVYPGISGTPLHYAARTGNIEIARYLVEAGADVSKRDCNDGTTPLHCASELDVLTFLAEKSEEGLNTLDRVGRHVLHYASGRGDLDVVRCLVKEKEADVNMLEYKRKTPLHSAVRAGQLKVARYLVEAGANINAKDRHNETPLERAVREKYYDDMIRYLLEQGVTKSGKTKFQYLEEDASFVLSYLLRIEKDMSFLEGTRELPESSVEEDLEGSSAKQEFKPLVNREQTQKVTVSRLL